MSNEAIKWARGQKIKGGAKAVLVTLADRANSAQACWPSQDQIAEDTGIAGRTVRRHLAALEAAEGDPDHLPGGPFIVRYRRNNRDGSRSSDRCVLLVNRSDRPVVNLAGRGPSLSHPLPDSYPARLAGRTDDLPANLAEPTGQSGQGTQREPKEVSSSKKPSSRGTRLDKGWLPTPEAIAWARSEGIPDDLAKRETAKFIDYWISQPGTRGAKADWQATWRNWLRKAQEQQPGTALVRANGGSGQAPSPGRRRMDEADAVIERLREMEEAAAGGGAGQLGLPEVTL